MKGETLVLILGGGIQGSKEHGEIEVRPFGAFQMAMKGRGDASQGRREEPGGRWMVGQATWEARKRKRAAR